MRIIIDAMSGDNAPQEIVKGAVLAKRAKRVDITLVGRETEVRECLDKEGCEDIEVVNADEIIRMEDEASAVIKRKNNSSMAVALRLLRDGKGDAVVSAGNTGALLTGATLIVKRIRGIRRAAMAPVLPAGDHGVMLIDCGANAECTAEYLLQFAYMGSFYAKKIMNCGTPRVALLNIGTENTKGGELQRKAFELLHKAGEVGEINFVGNIEGTGVFSGEADVVVTDGFSGNILLKTAEGMIRYMVGTLEKLLGKSAKNKLASSAIQRDLVQMKKTLDVNEIGGTAFIGISKPVIKAHGSSNAAAICAAVNQAADFAESGIIDEISANTEHILRKAE